MTDFEEYMMLMDSASPEIQREILSILALPEQAHAVPGWLHPMHE